MDMSEPSAQDIFSETSYGFKASMQAMCAIIGVCFFMGIVYQLVKCVRHFVNTNKVYTEARKHDTVYYAVVYRQLNFSSQLGVANEILENKPKSCV